MVDFCNILYRSKANHQDFFSAQRRICVSSLASYFTTFILPTTFSSSSSGFLFLRIMQYTKSST